MEYLGKLERKPKEERINWKARIDKLKKEFERNFPGKRIISVYMEDTAYFWKEK